MYELPEVSELEQLLSDYSDLYKDVWGAVRALRACASGRSKLQVRKWIA